MLTALNITLILLSTLLCIPIGMFCLEVALSLFPRKRPSLTGASDIPPIAVLIPAHNEELVLGRTLETLLPTLGAGHRVLVVADNCTDQTAKIAARHKAEVIERFDTQERGKGYAVAFGLQHLAANPPTAVVFL